MQRIFFAISPTSPGFDKLPRAVRVAVRKASIIPRPTPTPAPTRTSIDCDATAPYINDAHYYNANTVDPDFDIDGSQEFDDCMGEDYEAHGLTIIEPEHGSVRRWLKGYDVL